MAWDALGGIFSRKNQRSEEDNGLAGGFRSAGGGASAPSVAATPNAAFGGDGGTAAGPVRAGFVNFGTLYDANKDAAAGMANNVYRGAESKAESAKGKLQSAQDAFKNQYGAGLGKGPVGGPHGTRIDNYNPSGGGGVGEAGSVTAGSEGKGSKESQGTSVGWDDWRRQVNAGTGRPFEFYAQNQSDLGQSRDDMTGTPTRGSADPGNYSGSGGTTTGGASRYASLYGPVSTMGSVDGGESEVPDKTGLADYHASTDVLGAKSGAGQQYTGPGSLKESMGDEAFAGLQDELRKAEAGVDELGNAGGIATALGYGPGDSTGMSALDAGLTQVAGQSNFKKLGEKYGNIGDSLTAAQADSLKSAEGGKAISEQSAKEWQDLLDEYEAAQGPGDDAANVGAKDKAATNYGGVSFQTSNGFDTNANVVTGAGYTATELQDLVDSGDLTQAEWDWLNSMSADSIPIIGSLGSAAQGATSGTDPASVKQNILAKLQARKDKKGG